MKVIGSNRSYTLLFDPIALLSTCPSFFRLQNDRPFHPKQKRQAELLKRDDVMGTCLETGAGKVFCLQTHARVGLTTVGGDRAIARTHTYTLADSDPNTRARTHTLIARAHKKIRLRAPRFARRPDTETHEQTQTTHHRPICIIKLLARMAFVCTVRRLRLAQERACAHCLAARRIATLSESLSETLTELCASVSHSRD